MPSFQSFFSKSSPESVPANVQTVSVFPRLPEFDQKRQGIQQQIADLGIPGIEDVRVGKMYLFEHFTEQEVDRIREEVLHEDTHLLTFQGNRIPEGIDATSQYVCVAYQKQVTNPEIDSLQHAIERIGIPMEAGKACQTAEFVLLYGQATEEGRKMLSKQLINLSIQQELQSVPETLRVIAEKNTTVDVIPISKMDAHALDELSSSRRLFLDTEEMLCIQNHFKGLGREPTDCEIELIAQSWSEHCGHKTFKSNMIINGERKKPLYQRLKAATTAINHPGVISCFVDNSGVVRFDENTGVCIKAETHSAPAAIEPYGGTETGIGGVIRDILATGLGAKPVGVFDVIGFGSLDVDQEDVPPGCLHPQTLFREVVAGVASYGNKVGLPNVSGAVFFHEGFTAKPVVLAGSIGLIPLEKAQKGKPRPGDTILIIGGKTGKDGIHGATFSSGSMTDETKEKDSTSVQIGYPVLKRRIMDVLSILFQQNKIHAINDVGGGGLSSAVTEYCEGTGGTVELAALTTKYQGLKPWEHYLSESQERMVLALSPEDVEEVVALCKHYGLSADVFGTFNQGDNKLRITFEGLEVANLDIDFVLHGDPRKVIEGVYEEPVIHSTPIPQMSLQQLSDLGSSILSSPNVCSRESVIRRYDHSVTGTITAPYFDGDQQDAPQDSLVLRPRYDSDHGITVTHGLAPEIGYHDPYWGSVTSVIEAISNAVARGADPSKIYLIDNFVHPKPDNPVDIGTLDRSLEGIVDASKAFGTPFVSGKDSLGGTYRDNAGREIKAPPTVIVSAVSILENVDGTVPSCFQKAGSKVVFIGDEGDTGLAGSAFAKQCALDTNDVPRYDLAAKKRLFDALHSFMKTNAILSCHDIREGGLFAALSEMTMGRDIGIDVTLSPEQGEHTAGFLFSEAAGRFVIEVPASTDIEKLLAGLPHHLIGQTTDTNNMVLRMSEQQTSLPIATIREKIHNPLFEKVIPLPSGSASRERSHDRHIFVPRRDASLVHPEVLVVKAPGTNSEAEMAAAFAAAGAHPTIVDIVDLERRHFRAAQILGIPGGFSYGDDISAGKILALDLAKGFSDEISEFMEADKLVLAICNGFQALVKTGLLPDGRFGKISTNLLPNTTGGFISKDVRLRIEESICRWTQGLDNGILNIPMAHGEGRFFASPEVLQAIEEGKQVVFRYVDAQDRNAREAPDNPNGSSNAIAGITDTTGKVLGMMPHPERDPNNFRKRKPERLIGLDVLRNGVRYFD